MGENGLLRGVVVEETKKIVPKKRDLKNHSLLIKNCIVKRLKLKIQARTFLGIGLSVEKAFESENL